MRATPTFKISTFLLLLLLGLAGIKNKCAAQSVAPEDMEKFRIMEDSMMVTCDSMAEAFLPDSHIMYSERLVRQLVRTLKIPNSYYFSFDKLKDKLNIIYADDNAFRIFNWSINTSEVTHRYYGAIQVQQPTLKLFGLSDFSEELGKGGEDSVLTGGKWLGALYYNVIGHDFNGHRVYTLFGFSEEGIVSNKKILDPLTLTDRGPVFGAPIFGVASNTTVNAPINRFILEYKKGVHVSLNWDKEKQIIVFDDLASEVNDPNRKYTFVPTGEYNCFRWQGDNWFFIPNFMPVQILQNGQAPDGDEPTGK